MSRVSDEDRADRKALAAAFARRRPELVEALFLAIRDPKSATWPRPQTFGEVHTWGKSQLTTAVELFRKVLETGDPVFAELFHGWMSSPVASALTPDGLPEDYKADQALRLAKPAWVELLAPGSSSRAQTVLDRELDAAIAPLALEPRKTLRALFIGDCLQNEVLSVLQGAASRDRVAIAPRMVTEKVPSLLRNRIREFTPAEFDLIFFSPFSHRFLTDYDVLLSPKAALWPASKVEARLDQLLHEVSTTIEALASHFDGKIYVHNTVATTQTFGFWSGLAKNLVTKPTRSRIRRVIREAVAGFVNHPRYAADARVHLLDEHAMRDQASDLALSRVFFDSFNFHASRLGVALGRGPYREAVFAQAHLVTKKVVVCDLDNTLWDGVIGEGAVKPFLDRQSLLLELRRRGVLLSINSKNDPRNVGWTGGRLAAADFVAPQINWEPKVANMARIRDELNLKIKDFVFLDDRPDELARMREAYPEILALDATDPATWRLIAGWQRLLPPNPDEDRTKLYHERVEREQFVDEIKTAEVEDETAALAALGLTVKIKEAKGSELKRVVELINRTNQFNLAGSRTTLRELQDGLGKTHTVLTAEASDKFGGMGIVGVMVARWNATQTEIPIFVLSCRVFGFGIEYALLNALKRVVPDDHAILGHYQETPLNEPCRKLYPESGLNWDGHHWVGKVADLPDEPSWLEIRHEIHAKVGGPA
jgi:FkbH-like protein